MNSKGKWLIASISVSLATLGYLGSVLLGNGSLYPSAVADRLSKEYSSNQLDDPPPESAPRRAAPEESTLEVHKEEYSQEIVFSGQVVDVPHNGDHDGAVGVGAEVFVAEYWLTGHEPKFPFPPLRTFSDQHGAFSLSLAADEELLERVLIVAEGSAEYSRGELDLRGPEELSESARRELLLKRTQHGELRGLVTDLQGTPIANAHVSVQGLEGRVDSWTEADGRFVLPRCPRPLQYVVDIEKQGYRALASTKLTRTASGGWRPIHVRLAAVSKCKVKVMDGIGMATAAVLVSVNDSVKTSFEATYWYDHPGYLRANGIGGTRKEGGDGSLWTVDGVWGGVPLTIHIMANGVRYGYNRVGEDGVLLGGTGDGDLIVCDSLCTFSVSTAQFTLNGEITDAVTASGIEGIFLYVYDSDGRVVAMTRSGISGLYRVSWDPGGSSQWRVVAADGDFIHKTYTKKAEASVEKGAFSAGPAELNLALGGAEGIKGVVVDDDGGVVVGTLHVFRDAEPKAESVVDIRTSPDGTFEIKGLESGMYTLQFICDPSRDEPCFVTSEPIQAGSLSVTLVVQRFEPMDLRFKLSADEQLVGMRVTTFWYIPLGSTAEQFTSRAAPRESATSGWPLSSSKRGATRWESLQVDGRQILVDGTQVFYRSLSYSGNEVIELPGSGVYAFAVEGVFLDGEHSYPVSVGPAAWQSGSYVIEGFVERGARVNGVLESQFVGMSWSLADSSGRRVAIVDTERGFTRSLPVGIGGRIQAHLAPPGTWQLVVANSSNESVSAREVVMIPGEVYQSE